MLRSKQFLIKMSIFLALEICLSFGTEYYLCAFTFYLFDIK